MAENAGRNPDNDPAARMADAIRRAQRLVGYTQMLLERTQMIVADSRKRRHHTSMAMRLSRTMRRERAFARRGP